MRNDPIAVGIVGLGTVAGRQSRIGADESMTHLQALIGNHAVTIEGVHDIAPEVSGIAHGLGVQFYLNLEDFLAKSYDIIIVSSPTSTHQNILHQIALRDDPPGLVICEKPLSSSLRDSLDVVRLFEAKGIMLWVNYQRRLDSRVLQLKKDFEAGILGQFLFGSLTYEKGIKHNGSHGVDLARFILGEPRLAVKVSERFDYFQDDPTTGGCLLFNNSPLNLNPGHQGNYSIFELDFAFENQRYRFTRSGTILEVSSPGPDPVFPGYVELVESVNISSGFEMCFPTLIENAVKFLRRQQHLSVLEAKEILNTQRIAEILAHSPVLSPVKLEVDG